MELLCHDMSYIYITTIAASLPQSFICANNMLALNVKLIEYVVYIAALYPVENNLII